MDNQSTKEKTKIKPKKSFSKDLAIQSIQTTIENMHRNILQNRCVTSSNNGAASLFFTNGSHKRASSGGRKSSTSKNKKEAGANEGSKKKNTFSFFNNFGPTNLRKYSSYNVNSSNVPGQGLMFKKSSNMNCPTHCLNYTSTQLGSMTHNFFGSNPGSSNLSSNLTNYSMVNPFYTNQNFFNSNIASNNNYANLNINNKKNYFFKNGSNYGKENFNQNEGNAATAPNSATLTIAPNTLNTANTINTINSNNSNNMTGTNSNNPSSGVNSKENQNSIIFQNAPNFANLRKKCIKIFQINTMSNEEIPKNQIMNLKGAKHISNKELHFDSKRGAKKDPSEMDITPSCSEPSNSAHSSKSKMSKSSKSSKSSNVEMTPVNPFQENTLEYLLFSLLPIKLKKDPQFAFDYLVEIYPNLLKEEKESKIKIDGEYMTNQPEINEQMRAILLDWLIDVHLKFGFREETLYMTIHIIDSYLSMKKILRSNLQLLGVTALLISCKHEEIFFPKTKEFVYITDNAYKKEDLLKMEYEILKTLNFNLLHPSPLKFYEILSILLGFNSKQFFLGKFLMEWFMLDYKGIRFSNSVKACACAYITMKYFKMQNYKICYDPRLFSYDGLDEIRDTEAAEIIKTCAKEMCSFCDAMNKGNLLATKKKYASSSYEKVSEMIYPPNGSTDGGR